MNMMVPSSGWQGVRLVEAKAFEFYDIGKAFDTAMIVACCRSLSSIQQASKNRREAYSRQWESTLSHLRKWTTSLAGSIDLIAARGRTKVRFLVRAACCPRPYRLTRSKSRS